MMVSMEVYLRRGQKGLQRLLLRPGMRKMGSALLWGGGAFLLSAASLMHSPIPLAVGLICAGEGRQGLVMALGAMAGYPVFWGLDGGQGIVWAAAAGLLAVMLGNRPEKRDWPLMIPVITAFLVLFTGLVFWILWGEGTSPGLFALRGGVALLSGVLFTQVAYCRDAIGEWMVWGVTSLALAQVAPVPWLGLGYVAGGMLAAAGAFPAAALAGLGLDLAGVTKAPMTAVLCMAYFVRMIPFDKKWQQYAAPGAVYVLVMEICGVRDWLPVPGLVLGGFLGALLPPKPRLHHRRGNTGAAQVRLELGAEVMAAVQRTILEMEPPPIDEGAILEKARERACGTCAARRSCTQRENLTAAHLKNPLEADCRKPGRLLPELRRGQEQLRLQQAQRQRQRECRGALIQQYRFLGDYLRALSDRLPRRGEVQQAEFAVEVSARSRGKEQANGDACIAFPGPGCRYFLLLCDGMGTGIGAQQEGRQAARLLRQMLTAGFPPEHALRSYNSLLALRGAAGAVTLDLAEVRLDKGTARIFKWGAAPSWLLTRKGMKKIGTAAPPPGISVGKTREAMEKLSLRRGEVLILVSDGVDGEDVQRLSDVTPDAPPGELAAKILENGGGNGEDDATAAVLRLRPAPLGIS